MEDNNKKAELYRKWAIRLAFLGLFVLVLFLVFMGTSGMLFGFKINPQYTALVGTFIGGTIGAIWSLTGVLLYYAALVYQREEIRLMITTNKNLQTAYDDQKLAYKEQLDNAKLMKFQSSFYELLKLFLSKRDELTNSSRLDTRNGKLIQSFNEITNELLKYAAECNSKWEQPESHILFHTALVHADYNHKFLEFIEFFILIYNEIYRYEDKIVALSYERIFLNILTFNQISSVIYYAATDIDNSGRLKDVIMRSEVWESRCLVMLNQIPEISLFWTRYHSKNRSMYS